MTPLQYHVSSSTTSKLHASTEKNYSAEWIDLQSKESYESSIPLPGQIDPPRSGAVSFSTPNNDKLFTFAGYAEVISSSQDGPPERYVVNDLWQFMPYPQEADTTSSWGWTKIVQDKDGYIPGPRLATAMAVHPTTNKAVLLGGWDPQTAGTGGIILDDVSLFDLESLEWSPCIHDIASNNNEVTIPDGPTSRHVAVTLALECPEDDEKELHHAICLHNHRCDDHVLLLHLDKDGEGQWENQPVTGNVPSSRGLHCAATLTHDNTSKAVVIFGGAAKDGNMSNEAYALDVKTWKWTKLDCGNDDADVPSPRAGACLAPVDEDSVVLFGGATPAPGGGGLLGLNDVWMLHVDLDNGTGKWECLVRNQSNGDEKNDDIVPPGRNAATLSPISIKKVLPKDLVWKQHHGQKTYYFLLQVSLAAAFFQSFTFYCTY